MQKNVAKSGKFFFFLCVFNFFYVIPGFFRLTPATKLMTSPVDPHPAGYKKRKSFDFLSGCPVGFEPTTFRTTI